MENGRSTSSMAMRRAVEEGMWFFGECIFFLWNDG